jgi:hypothetical protein
LQTSAPAPGTPTTVHLDSGTDVVIVEGTVTGKTAGWAGRDSFTATSRQRWMP